SSHLMEQFETLYLKINLKQPFENPYDAADIQVDAIINVPNGQFLTLPCFYQAGTSKNSEWEARFTAMQSGTHTYYLRVIRPQEQDTAYSRSLPLEVQPSTRDGFLRLHPNSHYTLRFDSGKLFRGVGMNLGWELQSEWKYPYETYFDALEQNHANFIRTWICPWNLPLEWTRVNSYQTFTDELENWEKTFYHSPSLQLISGKTNFTEDDTQRVTLQSNAPATLIYHLPNIRRFKIKLFYQKELALDQIKCSVSRDDQSYRSIEIEFSQTWNTFEDWQRIFIARIAELPDGCNYLKLEFFEHLTGTPHLANVLIEHGAPTDILDAPGLGRYYQKTANRLDEILNLAAAKGIYLMLTIDYHGVFKSYVDRWASNAEWRSNPYNLANGGPCQSPTDFFTNPEAKRIYKNKLRYLVARWGYATHLAVWEFWNEIDNVMEAQQVPAAAIVNWHQEMADYLKQIDPSGHLVSTSVTYREIPGLWEIKNLDFTQHHHYGPTEIMRASILKYIGRFHKPDVVGEFALGWKGPGKDYPVELYAGELHHGLWRGLFSPTPILPLTWWWEWHYAQRDYAHFKTAADFVAQMLSQADVEFQDLPVRSGATGLEVLGLKAGQRIFIWVQNSTAEVVHQLTLQIETPENLNYLVKYYDPGTGKYSEDREVKIIHQQFILQDLQLKAEADLAIWLRPIGK
ncbi:DUF5060 domain-containing protein, partial [candidate division KSB1 bacterium]|nr:DUF5060 domain-containing protein [candidate division KSB1 bacterium]